jgi:hypothetical protein
LFAVIEDLFDIFFFLFFFFSFPEWMACNAAC